MQVNAQQYLQAVHTVIYQKKGKNIQHTVLNEVFELRQQIDALSSESEFSRNWLARCELYARTLRFKQTNPTAICASKLQHYASCMTATDRHAKLGKQFIKFSEQCHTQINTDAKAWWEHELRV